MLRFQALVLHQSESDLGYNDLQLRRCGIFKPNVIDIPRDVHSFAPMPYRAISFHLIYHESVYLSTFLYLYLLIYSNFIHVCNNY